MQRLMPEGYGAMLCKDFNELYQHYSNSDRIFAKVISLDPMLEEIQLQVTSDNSVTGFLRLDSVTFSEKSLVGQFIECCFATEPQTNIPCEFVRNTKNAEEYCLTNYHVGDKVIGKVVSFLSYGTMVDIGGGYCALLPNNDFLNGIKHGTTLLKEGNFINVIIKEISDNKIKLMYQ